LWVFNDCIYRNWYSFTDRGEEFFNKCDPPRTLKKGKENVGASEESKDKVKDLKEFKWRWLIKKQMLLLKLFVKSGVVLSSVDMLFGSKGITVLYNIYYLLVK